MAPLHILLTFDDGPHAGELGGGNRTEKVATALGALGITAAFFIQTHVSFRLPAANGTRVVSRIHADGHVLAIHTGSAIDHRCHKWRCLQPADMNGAVNGLDADMIRAKAAIREISGSYPEFVRATYGYTDRNCMTVYCKNGLRHVYWDIASGDDEPAATRDSVHAALRKRTLRLINLSDELIYLMHDITELTAEHIRDFINVIGDTVSAAGRVPMFVADRPSAQAVMRRKSRSGTDMPCPPDSMD